MSIKWLLFLAFSFFLLVLIPDAKATDVSACGTLNLNNTVYDLTQNVNSIATCFDINGENITLDCHGYEINYSSSGTGSKWGVYSDHYNAIIKNCIIKEGLPDGTPNYAIYLRGIDGGYSNTISNNTIITTGINSYGIYVLNSNNNTLSNNTITTYGSTGLGIYLLSSANSNTLSNNIITTSGNAGYGITLSTNSNNNTISNNTVTTSNTTGYGIYLYTSSNYNIFSNNTITTSGISSLGIYLKSNSNSNTISSNTITTNGSSGYGVYLLSSSNSNILLNNTITTSGNASYGIFLESNSNSNTILSNNISTSGFSSLGIYLKTNNLYNTISNNIINTINISANGAYILSSNTNLFSSNIITTSGPDGYGIYVLNSNNNTLSNNTITTYGTTGSGIYLQSNSNSNTVSANTITTYNNNGRGIQLSASNSNIFLDNTITTSGADGRGIWALTNSNNNSFLGMNIKTSNGSGYSFMISNANHNFTIQNSLLNSSKAVEFLVDDSTTGGIWNLTNVSRSNGDKINISWQASANGTLNYKWWLTSNVTNSLGNLQGATIYAYDKDGNLMSSGTTDSNGNSKIALLEFTNINNTLITYYSNYTINITKIGYKSYIAVVNMSNNTLLNTELNFIPTTPNLIAPNDLSSLSTSYAVLKYNSTDLDNATDTITFWVYGDQTTNPTTLIFNGTGYGNTTYNWSSLSDGNYYWKVMAGDGHDNSSNSSIYKFTVSTNAPAINLNYPTYGLWSATTSVLFNFTAEDSDGIQNCNLWGNFSGSWAFNETLGSITSGYHNTTTKTLKNENYYIWNMNCSDTSENYNFYTSNFTFYVDSVYPALSIKEITTVDNSQTISFDINNTDYAISSCKYSIYKNNSIDGLYNNISVACISNDNPAVVSSYGAFTLRVYGKDMAGNENSTDLSFTTRQVTSEAPGGGGSTVIEEIRCTVDGDCTPKLGKEYKCVQTYCIYKPYEDVCNRNGICEPERGESVGNCGSRLLNNSVVLEGDCHWTSGTDLLKIALSTNYILWSVFIVMVLAIALLVQTKEGSFTQKTYKRYFRRRR